MPSHINLNTSTNTGNTVDVDVPDPSTSVPSPTRPGSPSVGSRPRSSSVGSRPTSSHPSSAPTSSPLAPSFGGGPLPPLVGTATTVTTPAGSPAPRARAQTWSMGQPVGAGGALINFARTPASPATSATTTTTDPNATTSTTTTTTSSDPTTTTNATTTATDPTTTDPTATDPTTTDPTTTDPTATDSTATDPTATDPAPQNLPPKPWPNPDNPTKRHIRLATAGIGTKPGGAGAGDRDQLVMNELQRPPDDADTQTEVDLGFVDSSLDVARQIKRPNLRALVLMQTHDRLLKIRADLHTRGTIPAMQAKYAAALERADVALASAYAAKDVDQRMSHLKAAQRELGAAAAYTRATGEGSDPDSVFAYLDARLADAEGNAGADGAHHAAVQNTESVQKLYVGPEWMFRRSAGDPYSAADFQKIKGKLAELSAKYPDWLIIPGTVYHGDPDGHGKFLVRNDALIAHNGAVQVTSKQHEQDALAANEAWSPGPEASTRFTADGHKYAVEICRDHFKGMAAAESDDLVDFHVVTSNGVAMAPHAVVARDGGLVVHVDGEHGTTTVYRVKWLADPNAGAARAFRAEAKQTRDDITALDLEYATKKAEADAIWEDMKPLKKLQKEGKLGKKDAATLAALDAKFTELDGRLTRIMQDQKKASNKLNADTKKFIQLTSISSGDGVQVPENILELETDRYA